MIDSHAHLTDARFAGEVEAVLERARTAGVDRVVTIGTDLPGSRAAAALAASYPDVYASAGIHPHSADGATREAMAEIAEMAMDPRVVAIGETGLDYHYDNADREVQRSSFLSHIELGRELDLPLVVHAREADDDVVAILAEAGEGTRGVLHCFAGGREMLEAALDLGWYASFSGMITFKSYGSVDLLRSVPLDRIMIETDSPYLAPVPHRGRRNEPAHVTLVAARAAELRGEDTALLAAASARNAADLYRIG